MANLEKDETARERGGSQSIHSRAARRGGPTQKSEQEQEWKEASENKKKERQHAACSGKQIESEGMKKTKNGISECVSVEQEAEEGVRGGAAGKRGACERGHKTSASLCSYLSFREIDKEEQKKNRRRERGRERRKGSVNATTKEKGGKQKKVNSG